MARSSQATRRKKTPESREKWIIGILKNGNFVPMPFKTSPGSFGQPVSFHHSTHGFIQVMEAVGILRNPHKGVCDQKTAPLYIETKDFTDEMKEVFRLWGYITKERYLECLNGGTLDSPQLVPTF